MNVASLELCKDLVYTSEWGGTEYFYLNNALVHRSMLDDDDFLGEVIPAYDLGYLLRKLPPEDKEIGYLNLCQDGVNWMCRYTKLSATMIYSKADIPEDAAAKLAIELFKQGILTPTHKDKGEL